MAIKPVIHRILVKPDVLEEVDETYKKAKQAGIVLDFNERNREQAAVDTGVVVSFGPTAFQDFHTVNPLTVGDRIVYARYGGKAVTDPQSKEKYILLNDEDVIAILT